MATEEDKTYPADGAGAPPCFYCKHLIKAGTQLPDGEGWTCKAFPDGISYAILSREEDHTKPLPLDNGYQFQVDLYIANDKAYRMDWWGNMTEVPDRE